MGRRRPRQVGPTYRWQRGGGARIGPEKREWAGKRRNGPVLGWAELFGLLVGEKKKVAGLGCREKRKEKGIGSWAGLKEWREGKGFAIKIKQIQFKFKFLN